MFMVETSDGNGSVPALSPAASLNSGCAPHYLYKVPQILTFQGTISNSSRLVAESESSRDGPKDSQIRGNQTPTANRLATVETGMEQGAASDCSQAATTEKGKTFEYQIEFRIRHMDLPIKVFIIGFFPEEDPAMISGFPASLEELRALRSSGSSIGKFPRLQVYSPLLKHFQTEMNQMRLI